ncbi:MAG: hypothetical protein JWO45_381 [Spartobacteria bacterium]|nr:hypothetical protein [Spartobacteria bacterium]
MKAPMFVLTKSEQRVVILIVLALLGGAFAIRYRHTQASSPTIKEAPINPAKASEKPVEADD